MKCPKCGFNSFEYLDSCKKCGKSLASYKDSLGISPIILSPAIAAATASTLNVPDEELSASPTESLPEDELFQWDTSASSSPPQEQSLNDPFDFTLDTPSVSAAFTPAAELPFGNVFPDEAGPDSAGAFPGSSVAAGPSPEPQNLSADSLFGEFSFDEPVTSPEPPFSPEIASVEQAWTPADEDTLSDFSGSAPDIFGELSSEEFQKAPSLSQGGGQTASDEFELEGFLSDEPETEENSAVAKMRAEQAASVANNLDSLFGEFDPDEMKK